MFKDKKKQFQIDIKHIPHGTQVVTLCDREYNKKLYKTGRTGLIINSDNKMNTYNCKIF